jgi:hypothetical protein
MSKAFALTLLGVTLMSGSATWGHHRYAPRTAVDITENGNLTTTENTKNQYGSHGKNEPHVHQ